MNKPAPTNFARLVSHRTCMIMVPPGTKNPFGTTMNKIAAGGLVSAVREANEWAKQACAVVRKAAAPNPWTNADDETIAAEIMRQVDAKKAAQ